jgi:hypothetical protein
VTSNVHLLDFNNGILILKMHGANVKTIIKEVYEQQIERIKNKKNTPTCFHCFC